MKFILIPHGIKQRKTVCQKPFFLHYTSERYGSRASCLIVLPLPEWTKIKKKLKHGLWMVLKFVRVRGGKVSGQHYHVVTFVVFYIQ